MNIKKLVPLLTLLALPTLVLADLQTQSFSFSNIWTEDQYDVNGTLIGNGNYSGSVTNNFSYSLFDTNLGTLTGVELCVHTIGSGDSMIDYYNWSGATNLPTITVTNNQGIGYNLTGSHDGWLDGSFVPVANNQTIFGTQTTTVSAPNSPGTWIMSPDDYATANFDQIQTFGASSHLSNWIGSGTSNASFERFMYQLTSYSATPPGGTNTTGDGAINTHWVEQTYNSEVTIKYTYTAVPEPGSGLTAMIGLGLIMRRSRSYKNR